MEMLGRFTGHLLIATAMWLVSMVVICTNRARPTPTLIKTIPLLRNRKVEKQRCSCEINGEEDHHNKNTTVRLGFLAERGQCAYGP
ncbi:hypothetical protein PVK06_026854 [Gossypium arboreum]|uniref:Secreted protein n=1 Tax=Gossypium arboreum TaxID=29729 RepID=A0ABR0NYS2_GOSAR|nr:hypothetical protein PVK06_026854 [Gossypium arboreum]